VKYLNYFILAFVLGAVTVLPAMGQESEPVVIDEVVAQVNDGVITLSSVKREMSDQVKAMVAAGKKEEEAKAEIDAKQGELIAGLINEELMVQKGKELGLDSDIEAMMNKRFEDIRKEQGLKTQDELFRKMREGGFSPEEIRATWRKQAMAESVLKRDVDSKLYHGFSGKELQEYFNKNKPKFIKPESLTLSEIYLSFAGRDTDAVRAKAKGLVEQLRSGGDFTKLAVENSERPDVKTTQGKLGTFSVNDLKDNVAIPLKGVKAGQVTDPVELDEGLMIIRVDERTGASGEAKFSEEDVRNMLTYERSPEQRKKYMVDIRKEAYIKISENYRAAVSPVLFADERAAPKPVVAKDVPKEKETKDKDKESKKDNK
jgi:peptidyl-prolyl cis-trans isomerase SurA